MKMPHFWTAASHTWPRRTFQPPFTQKNAVHPAWIFALARFAVPFSRAASSKWAHMKSNFLSVTDQFKLVSPGKGLSSLLPFLSPLAGMSWSMSAV